MRCAVDGRCWLYRIYFGEAQPGDVKDTAANTSRARKDLGFAPQTGIEQGLQNQVDWAMRPANARLMAEAIARPES